MTRAAILALLERRQAAVNAHDAETLTMLHAEDGVVESQIAGTIRGRAAIKEVYHGFFTAFPDVVLTIDQLILDGTSAAQVGMITGTDMGSFLGLPATRKSFRLPIVFIDRLGDGCIVHERRLYDFTGLLIQIGALKAKPV
jgi:steroid delta-isomerase-like uncharacterized protein